MLTPEEALARTVLHDSLKPEFQSDDEWERAGSIIRKAARESSRDMLAYLATLGFVLVPSKETSTPGPEQLASGSLGQREVLWQLFRNGPTWDGNIVSKAARDALFRLGLAARENGWSYLTREGVEAALAAQFDKRKDAERYAR